MRINDWISRRCEGVAFSSEASRRAENAEHRSAATVECNDEAIQKPMLDCFALQTRNDVTSIPGAVLPTVLVVSALLALVVVAVVSLWEADFLYFSRHRHEAMQRAHIASGFTLYAEYPDKVAASLDADSTLLLYDSVRHSRIGIKRRSWGLYETVTVSGSDGRSHATKIFGLRTPYTDDYILWCAGRNSAVTLTGKTRLKGRVRMPRGGIIYGQMGPVFFDGEKIEAGMMTMGEREEKLPAPSVDALAAIGELKELAASAGDALPVADSIAHGFYEAESLLFSVGERLENLSLSGNIVVFAEEVNVDRSCRLRDVIIVAEKVRIEEGFAGSLQVFASDSLNVEAHVTLDYPSGLFSEKYIGLADSVTVNGYVIVNPDDKPDPKNANYRQARHARVRGLVYIAGSAQFQGIVSGVAMLAGVVYYSPRGYYENMIYDATVLENPETAWPIWLDDGPPERKEAKWVN